MLCEAASTECAQLVRTQNAGYTDYQFIQHSEVCFNVSFVNFIVYTVKFAVNVCDEALNTLLNY